MKSKRPAVLQGKTIKEKTGCGSIYITLNYDDKGNLFEVRFSMGKAGHCVNTMLIREAVAISKWLQTEVDRDEVISFFKEHWMGVSCNNAEKLDDKRFSSCGDVIGRAILEELEKDEKEIKKEA